MSDAAEQSLDQAVEEWRELGIRAWTEAERPWFWYGESLGDDLAHSVGVVPHDLSGADVDFAVWCSYRYLNAGPGAIAGLYVNERHLGQTPALAGWWGHEKRTQFEMRSEFTPADSAGAWQIGTVPVLSAAPLAGALTSYLVHLLDEQLVDLDCAVGTPRAPERRGGHVAIEHPEAERVSETLRDRGIVVDFRPPNVIRVCPAPLYTRFVDLWAFTERLREILDAGEFADADTGDHDAFHGHRQTGE